eukprot:s518_g23.t1
MAAAALSKIRENYDGRRRDVSDAMRHRAIDKQKAAVLRLQVLQAERAARDCNKAPASKAEEPSAVVGFEREGEAEVGFKGFEGKIKQSEHSQRSECRAGSTWWWAQTDANWHSRYFQIVCRPCLNAFMLHFVSAAQLDGHTSAGKSNKARVCRIAMAVELWSGLLLVVCIGKCAKDRLQRCLYTTFKARPNDQKKVTKE